MATFHISLSLAPADTCMMIVQLAVSQSTTTHHALNQITAQVVRHRGGSRACVLSHRGCNEAHHFDIPSLWGSVIRVHQLLLY
jgi:hypothetical protein